MRVVAVDDVPVGFFPSLTTDALGRPIYSVTYGDIFDSATLTRVTVLRHLDGTWHLIDLPGTQPKPLRFVPTLGLFDGIDSVEPGRYAPVAAEDITTTTDLSGSPIDLGGPLDNAEVWATDLGLVRATADGFVLEGPDADAPELLARYPTRAVNDFGIEVGLIAGLAGAAADAGGHLFVTMRDGYQDDALGYVFVHFPGDDLDRWTQVPGFFGRNAQPINDGSGHVWLANTGALRDIVFD
ncbi:MAG: hypothetical protein JNJ59_20210 [Deltaproteobacteria bacterium]|nr:hypothetical protein [Deltaproteobacteria bacterium]